MASSKYSARQNWLLDIGFWFSYIFPVKDFAGLLKNTKRRDKVNEKRVVTWF